MSEISGKKDLAKSLVDAGLAPTVRKAEDIVQHLVESIVELVSEGHKVRIQQFGTFQQIHRAARMGRNPQTGAELEIPERKVLTFKASKSAA